MCKDKHNLLNSTIFCNYNFNSGKLFIASSFNLSTARVYFSVCFNPLCPNRLATVLMLAPLFRMFAAKLWRAQCQPVCLLIPARFTHRFTELLQLSQEGKSFLFRNVPPMFRQGCTKKKGSNRILLIFSYFLFLQCTQTRDRTGMDCSTGV